MERIYAGLIKFVAGGKDAFLIKYNSMSRTGKYNAPGIDEPCPVVATQNRLGVAFFQNSSVDTPKARMFLLMNQPEQLHAKTIMRLYQPITVTDLTAQ